MLQSLLTEALWPVPFIGGSAAYTTIDASLDFVAQTFVAPETGTITNIHFRVGTVSASQELSGGIYDIDSATGAPSTVVGTVGTVTPTVSGDIYSFTGISASVTKGTKYAIKIAFSGTVGTIAITTGVISSQIGSIALFPYQIVSIDNGGTLVKRTNGVMTPASLEYSGGIFHSIMGLSPVGTSESKTLASNGIIAAGIRFQVPIAMRISGLWAGATFANGSGFNLELLNDTMIPGDTPLAISSCDEDILSSNTNGIGMFLFDGGTTVTLVPGVWYKAVIRTTTAINMTFYRLTSIPNADHIKQMYGTSNVQSTSYTAGVWTNSDTTISSVGLIINGIHDAAGVGNASMSIGI